MIEVKNVEKSFGDSKVLKGVSTVFETGKTNLIIGQSGSGKTVLLKSLLGIHTPEVGTISFDGRIYSDLTSDHPIDLARYQVANCYMGKIGLINSGGASGSNDFAEATQTAVINKRAGGHGLISGRKAFQRPMEEGVKLLNTIQDVYLSKEITIA